MHVQMCYCNLANACVHCSHAFMGWCAACTAQAASIDVGAHAHISRGIVNCEMMYDICKQK